MGPGWVDLVSALVLIALMALLSVRRLRDRLMRIHALPADMTLRVQGMTCTHCVASVKRALEGCDAVDEATPDLGSGLVRVRGKHLDASALIAAVEKVGFRQVVTVEPNREICRPSRPLRSRNGHVLFFGPRLTPRFPSTSFRSVSTADSLQGFERPSQHSPPSHVRTSSGASIGT